MPLNYQPKEGSIVRCDFRGMIEPEMLKMRDVVVIRSHKQNRKLVTIIPLSATAPKVPQPYHYEIPNPRPDDELTHFVWAKCDMVYTVSLERLDTHYIRSRRGGRFNISLKLSPLDFLAIKKCVAIALNLNENELVPFWGIKSVSA